MNDGDRWLRQCVLAELEREPGVDAARIGVAAKDGVVTLTGHVLSRGEKVAAERAVRGVRGVKALAQDIEVRLPSEPKTSDEEIAARAVQVLGWDTSVPRSAVSIAVERGWVTLSGEVDWHFQRAAAEYDVQRLPGVLGVVNAIRAKA